MAFGFSSKYSQDFPLGNLSPEQFLVIALEAAKKVDWNISYTAEAGFIAYTKFSTGSETEKITVKVENGNANLKSECTENQKVDWGKNKANIEGFIQTINDLKTRFTPEELAQKYEALKAGLVAGGEDLLNQPPPTAKERLAGVLKVFKPAEGYFVTPILIDLNIALFILMVISGVSAFLPDNESLIKWGANFRPVTLGGEWWRLITNCFLHIGILHLLLNMYALLYIGSLLEPHLGRARFAVAYLLTGITASITSLWWHDLTISAGASGAIFGMYGVFLSMLTTNLIEKSARKELLASIGIFVAYNLLNGLKGGIDNAAHIGGLAGGLVIGYAYIPSLKKPGAANLKYAIMGGLAVLILSTSFVVYKKIPNDIAQYEKKIKSFISTEEMALEVYKLPQNSSKEKTLSAVDNGIYYWKENIKLLTDLEKLNLPDEVHSRNKKLLDYCDLRVKSYNLLHKAIDVNTGAYDDSIKVYNNEIEKIINELGGK